MTALTLSPDELMPVVLLTVTIIAFPISYYLPWIYRPWLATRGVRGRNLEIAAVLLDRLTGTIVLGVPALALLAWLPPRANRYGFNLDGLWLSLLVAGISCLVVWAALTFCAARGWAWAFKGYPQMRIRDWDLRLIALNSLGWAVYLLAYEILFRGALLYPLADVYGAWSAIIITTGLYSFTHLVKEPFEMFVTIVVGVLFGVLGLVTGSIVGPLLIHWFTAIFNDIAAIRLPGGRADYA